VINLQLAPRRAGDVYTAAPLVPTQNPGQCRAGAWQACIPVPIRYAIWMRQTDAMQN